MLHNIRAEQELLGALLLNGDAVAGMGLKPEHFYDPVHARIYAAIEGLRAQGRGAGEHMLAALLEHDPGMRELGGAQYLVTLGAAAAIPQALKDIALLIVDLWARRTATAAMEQAQGAVMDMAASPTLEDALGPLEATLAAVQADASRKPLVRPWSAAIMSALERANEAYQADGALGAQTGLTELDEMLGGLHPGNLLVLAGRPSMGKTAVALALAANVAATGGKVDIASLEMSPDEIGQRDLSMAAAAGGRRIPYSAIRRGKITEDDFRVIVGLARDRGRLPINVIGSEARDLGKLRSALAASARQRKPDLIVIDYLQRIVVRGAGSIYEKTTEAVGAVKALALRHECPVILLSQLSREVEKRDPPRPQMSDLRDSGAIEEDADQAVFVYRPEYYLQRRRPARSADVAAWHDELDRVRGKVELIVGKNRHGDIGTVRALLDVATNWLRDEEREDEAPASVQDAFL